ncbi:unnamed protein product [Effrenium voratum]|nr:unnamed protein product [Effrenium voratum]
MGRRCVVLCALGCLHFSLQRSWVSPREHAAVGYYTAALRGAATAVHGSESSGFKRLALLHYEAVELRRARKFAESSAVYRAAIALQETLPPTKEVPTFAAAACSWLNLALTEQKTSTCLDAARSAFQEGTRYVQGLIHKELDVWIDGHHQVRSRAPILERDQQGPAGGLHGVFDPPKPQPARGPALAGHAAGGLGPAGDQAGLPGPCWQRAQLCWTRAKQRSLAGRWFKADKALSSRLTRGAAASSQKQERLSCMQSCKWPQSSLRVAVQVI